MQQVPRGRQGRRSEDRRPGRVDTAARSGSLADPTYLAKSLARIPLQRLATADEVAFAVRYLASPAASYITGHTLVLDGGLIAQ